jgi:hypothetical protein
MPNTLEKKYPMTLRIKLGIIGFVLGLSVAMFLAALASNRNLSPILIISIWPTALFGIGATGWSDGVAFHIFQTMLVFGGNGALYGLVLSFVGTTLRDILKRSSIYAKLKR